MSVFVYADEQFCFDRAMERNSLSAHDLKKYIAKIDKYRGDNLIACCTNRWYNGFALAALPPSAN